MYVGQPGLAELSHMPQAGYKIWAMVRGGCNSLDHQLLLVLEQGRILRVGGGWIKWFTRYASSQGSSLHCISLSTVTAVGGL